MKLLNLRGQLSILARELASAKRREKRAESIKDWTEIESGISGGSVISCMCERDREKEREREK